MLIYVIESNLIDEWVATFMSIVTLISKADSSNMINLIFLFYIWHLCESIMAQPAVKV